jgi:GNAT superfamily N-acetyltransferase
VAGAAHIEQVSVEPTYARRRIGAQLIEAAAAWACGHGLRAMTLTSFALVPWNAPYYAKLGFAVLPDADQSPELREIRRAEAARGLDAWPRVAMWRPLK